MRKIILDKNAKRTPCDRPAVLCLGKFDGLHRGHERLLEELFEYGERGYEKVLLCFDRQPAAFFSGEKEELLSTGDELEELCRAAGVDLMAVYPVTEESMGLESDAFIRDVILGQLGVSAVVAGEDCSFGRGGLGDASLLKKAGADLGFEVKIVEKLTLLGDVVSSSRIKELLRCGNVRDGAALLGRRYSFSGRVAHGREKGRTIGFPTANLLPPPNKFIPLHGVYASVTYLDSGEMGSVTNIGTNPTVGGEGVSIETHILEPCPEIYDELIRVELAGFIRPEKRFDSLEQLGEQIREDVAAARKCLEGIISGSIFT